ncbi:Uncharacterized protein APZ42_008684, partial [Daphnia magna]
PPAYLLLPSEAIEDALNNILKKIPVTHQQTCATYFFRIAQQITSKHKDDEYYLRWDPDTAGIIHPRNIIQIVELYLQALLQLSTTLECSHLMVQNGLLLILWRIANMFDKEVVLTTLCA